MDNDLNIAKLEIKKLPNCPHRSTMTTKIGIETFGRVESKGGSSEL